MKQALWLAKLALGHTSPNPAVGAVVVKDDVVVGQGYTQPPGSWHAEVSALKQAGEEDLEVEIEYHRDSKTMRAISRLG